MKVLNRLVVLVSAATLAITLCGPARAQAQTVEYYHLDALGSVRAVTNQAGAVIERHDYLPFGEELDAVGTANPRKFTGKERDVETGLDYFGARYYGAKTARFTTVDPAQVLASLINPQQWNRYAYARNNPLRYVDPLGLFVCDPAATERQKADFRSAMTAASKAGDQLSGSRRDAVSAAIAAYGNEGDANGMTVGFGRLRPGQTGNTTSKGLDPTTLQAMLTVTFDSPQSGNLAITVAHEGSHIADFQAFYKALVADPKAFVGKSSVIGGPFDLTSYQTEMRAFNVSALVAIGLGARGLTVSGQQIMNDGTVNQTAISRMLAASKHYGLTPVNPGPRLSGQQ